MKIRSVRDILGIFYLGTTGFLGAYILLLNESILLPVSASDAMSAFQIIIPTFIVQLSILFKWMANPPQGPDTTTSLPSWAVIGPPVIVLLILAATIALIGWDQGEQLSGGAMLKNAVTFCVSLLGATSVIIVTEIFAKRGAP